MSKMYENAVIEAAKLRELAEQNAKNKIIEAITPRIRRLVEQELLDDEIPAGAFDDEMLDDEMMDDELVDDLGGDSLDGGYEMPDVDVELAPEDDALMGVAVPAGDEMAAPADDLVADELGAEDLMDDDLGMVDGQPTEFSFEKDGKQVKVSVTVEGSKSGKVLKVSPKMLKRFAGSKYNLRENSLGYLIASLNETKSARKRRAIINEIRKIRKKLIIMAEAGNSASRKKVKALDFLLKESMEMSRKNRRSRRLTERAWWLMEQDDLEGGDEELGLEDDLEMEEEGEEGDEEMVAKADVVDAVASLLDVPAEDLQDLALGGEEGLEGEEEEEDEFELEDEDLEEWAFREADDKDDDEDDDEDDDKKKDEMKENDEVVEISESMLRREIARMTRNRKRRSSRRMSESARRRARIAARRRRRLNENDPTAGSGASSFGGGDAGSEPFIEVDEDTLLNALAEELGEMTDGGGDANKAQDAFGGAGAVGGIDLDGTALATESRRRRARRRAAARGTTGRARVAEAAARRNAKRAQLAEAKAKAARKELKESNLFNAKLLYVNKLMQSYDLNTKQQRAIVEALDNAKTLREAKLLYTSLTESLRKRRTSGSGKINEGALRAGSASKSTRSSAPAKSGYELDRWAVLAGLNK